MTALQVRFTDAPAKSRAPAHTQLPGAPPSVTAPWMAVKFPMVLVLTQKGRAGWHMATFKQAIWHVHLVVHMPLARGGESTGARHGKSGARRKNAAIVDRPATQLATDRPATQLLLDGGRRTRTGNNAATDRPATRATC